MDTEIRKEIEDLEELGWTIEEIAEYFDLHPDYVNRTLSTIHKRQKAEELLREGLTQHEVAQRLNVSQPRISSWLSGYDYSERARTFRERRAEAKASYLKDWRATSEARAKNTEYVRRQRETIRGREASREAQRHYYGTEKGLDSTQRASEKRVLKRRLGDVELETEDE